MLTTSGAMTSNELLPLDMSEAETCRTYVVLKLHAAGWEDDFISEQWVITPGRIVLLGRRHTRDVAVVPSCLRVAGADQSRPTRSQDALKRLQAETQAELDALLPSVLDKAFKGEL